MGFMRGQGAVRRTTSYLNKGKIYLKDKVKIVAFQWNPDDTGPANYGMGQFMFWHLAQIQYKNPKTHLVTFHKTTPTPWIKAYFDGGNSVVFDCDCRTREEIHDQVLKVIGKTDKDLKTDQIENTPSALRCGFGHDHPRFCICEVPGQIPCPAWKPLPKHLTGLYHIRPGLKEQEEED